MRVSLKEFINNQLDKYFTVNRMGEEGKLSIDPMALVDLTKYMENILLEYAAWLIKE